MYLIRRTAMWLSKFRGGDIVAIADTFGLQLFGELDYVREANNCENFRALYGHWDDVEVPPACIPLTRKKVIVMEWVDGEKGPWKGSDGLDMVRIGLRCSTDQLLRTGLFHADPHRGNLLRTPKGHLAVIDFGMMVSKAFRFMDITYWSVPSHSLTHFFMYLLGRRLIFLKVIVMVSSVSYWA